MKTCAGCHETKDYSEFHRNAGKKDGYATRCKSCRKQYSIENREAIRAYKKAYRDENRESIREAKKQYYIEHRDSILEGRKQYYNENHDSIIESKKQYYNENHDSILESKREYYVENRESILQGRKQYYIENREPIIARITQYTLDRLKRDMNFKIRYNLRNRVYNALHGTLKSDTTMKLLGCTIPLLHEWMEFQFYDGMDWDNYGEYWHIDHVMPCSSFDLTDPEQQKECFQWSNLRPKHVKERQTRWVSRNATGFES
jgi:transposase-like protein